MTVGDLFRKLSYGELSNLAMSEGAVGTIVEAKHPQVILHANEGLERLFTRFSLVEKAVILEMQEDLTVYALREEYADTSDSLEVHYIKDLPDDPFLTDAVVRIISVYDEEGYELPLNDRDDSRSLFTPKPTTLQVPDPVGGRALNVLYQARHPRLLDQGEDLLAQEISLPIFLETALTSFIAHKIYSHMNGQENLVKSQEFAATFETICADVEERDLVNQSATTSHNKLERRGFV